jgi:hypothetical protein
MPAPWYETPWVQRIALLAVIFFLVVGRAIIKRK